jgi:acyl-homoserine lactone acylase PvdQ
MRRIALSGLGLILAIAPRSSSQAPAFSAAERQRLDAVALKVTIYRDTWGVPHVFGPTDASVLFGAAYARAEDRMLEDEPFFLAALGRAAELQGEDSFPADRLARATRVVEVAQAEYRSSPPTIRALVDGYADGYNYYLLKHPETRWKVLGKLEPWQILAFSRLDGGLLLASPGELAVLRPPPAPASPNGSNAWAVGPSRSASGHAMLFANPHMAFDVPYEFHVHSDEGLVFSGMTAYMNPLPLIGRNAHLGWTLTVNYANVLDVYEVRFDDPRRPLAYRYGRGHRIAEEWVDTIGVRTANGVERRPVTLRRTHHGPVIEGSGGKRYAVRRANESEGGLFPQYYAMARATSFREFREALGQMRHVYHNVVYADRDGNIFYLYGATTPRRDPSFDWDKPLDGSNPATEWKGYHPVDELPQVLNPKSGWLQNTNSTPFFATGGDENPVVASYPRYMVREAHELPSLWPHLVDRDGNNLRSRASRRLLASLNKVTFEQLVEWATDNYFLAADEQLPGLIDEWRRFSGAEPGRGSQLEAPIRLLESWDRRGEASSVATTLFVSWAEALMLDPDTTTRWPKVAVLERVVKQLADRYGTWRIAWGDISRHQRPDARSGATFDDNQPSLPLPGANANVVGSIFTATTRPAPNQKRRYGVFGNTYVAVMEFGPRPRAITVVPYGQSFDPKSPHYFDQAPLFVRGAFKPSWFAREEIEANLERKYRPGEAP